MLERLTAHSCVDAGPVALKRVESRYKSRLYEDPRAAFTEV